MEFKAKFEDKKFKIEAKNITEAIEKAMKLLKKEGDVAEVQALYNQGRVYTVTKKEGAEHWNHPNYSFNSYPLGSYNI